MLFLALLTLILSPFIEQHRWPFSYPADPSIITENADLKGQLKEKDAAFAQQIREKQNAFDQEIRQKNITFGTEKELADKWRFASMLRSLGKECRYHADIGRKASSTAHFWQELLHVGGWIGGLGGAQDSLQLLYGITIRIPGENSPCAERLQRALADIYPNPPSKIINNQQSAFLSSCAGQSGQDCSQIEIDY